MRGHVPCQMRQWSAVIPSVFKASVVDKRPWAQLQLGGEKQRQAERSSPVMVTAVVAWGHSAKWESRGVISPHLPR